MKKLLFLALLAFAAWYGWNHYRGLFERHASHEAVIVNDSGSPITRIRLKVDGQTLVKEEVAAGQRGVMPFRITNDSDFQLTWQWGDKPGELSWRGGMVAKGPMVQRHLFTIDSEGQVIYQAENKTVAPPPS